jgi:16S rRNA (guanine527-N7)-methyltransferase
MEIIHKYFSDFTPTQLTQLAGLQELYKEWNEKINVISRKDIDALYERHILHSLSISTVFDFKPGAKILDLGTGGGFPGVPLAILFPEVEFTLVDSINKKLKVIEEVASALNITNITTKHSRVEDLKGEQKYDYVVSRAVAQLKLLWQWSKPLLKKNNTSKIIEDATTMYSLICLKGGDLAQEIFESNTKPRVWDLHTIYKEDFFKEKFMLQVINI